MLSSAERAVGGWLTCHVAAVAGSRFQKMLPPPGGMAPVSCVTGARAGILRAGRVAEHVLGPALQHGVYSLCRTPSPSTLRQETAPEFSLKMDGSQAVHRGWRWGPKRPGPPAHGLPCRGLLCPGGGLRSGRNRSLGSWAGKKTGHLRKSGDGRHGGGVPLVPGT